MTQRSVQVSHPLKIGFLSANDPYDRGAFSGTTFHAARALAEQAGVDLTILGPYRPQPDFIRRLKAKFRPPGQTQFSANATGLDAVVSLVSHGLLDTLKTPHPPTYHVTDATADFLASAYGQDISDAERQLEAKVAATTRRVVYSSAYMMDRARTEYGLSTDRLAWIPFGTNIDALPSQAPTKPPASPLRLLFVGGDWARKGGNIAVETAKVLTERGLDVQLTLVGARPPFGVPDCVRVVGPLNKNNRAEAQQLDQLYADAHIFVLPTRADCTPMVIAEANVQGTPVLVTDTGGIASLIGPGGENGRLMPMSAAAADWADAITEVLPHLEKLRPSSHAYATTHLTWNNWATRLLDIIRQDLQKSGN